MRTKFLEEIEVRYPLLVFGREEALVYSSIWAELASRGQSVGTHDLLIAAIAIRHGYRIATLNASEFGRVPRLSTVDASAFRT
jgi:tRNA(fMet)-specific endonuclease VapC